MKKGTKNISSPEEVFCPACGEKLTPVDIEVYPRCPYCDHQFDPTVRLEDFILSPIVTTWIGHCNARFPKK